MSNNCVRTDEEFLNRYISPALRGKYKIMARGISDEWDRLGGFLKEVHEVSASSQDISALRVTPQVMELEARHGWGEAIRRLVEMEGLTDKLFGSCGDIKITTLVRVRALDIPCGRPVSELGDLAFRDAVSIMSLIDRTELLRSAVMLSPSYCLTVLHDESGLANRDLFIVADQDIRNSRKQRRLITTGDASCSVDIERFEFEKPGMAGGPVTDCIGLIRLKEYYEPDVGIYKEIATEGEIREFLRCQNDLCCTEYCPAEVVGYGVCPTQSNPYHYKGVKKLKPMMLERDSLFEGLFIARASNLYGDPGQWDSGAPLYIWSKAAGRYKLAGLNVKDLGNRGPASRSASERGSYFVSLAKFAERIGRLVMAESG